MFLRSILPENRRAILKRKVLEGKRPVRIMESHNGFSAMVANDAEIRLPDGSTKSFDGIWVSGLTESSSRGLPDIELQGMLSRADLVREIAAVTDKPILVDGDTGGSVDQLQYYVRMLESLGVSALVIEDKVFPKSNSLDFNKPQVLEDPEVFARKIVAGRKVRLSSDFMLVARIEALVAGNEMGDAVMRAEHYLRAGADAIVIHSRKKTPDEILEFGRQYAGLKTKLGLSAPLISIPTTYNSITEEQLFSAGFDLVIHANHLLRSAYVAMKATAESILQNSRSLEVEPRCASLTALFDVIESADDRSKKS
jgi:phosphoenolpyruvate phosphomutase